MTLRRFRIGFALRGEPNGLAWSNATPCVSGSSPGHVNRAKTMNQDAVTAAVSIEDIRPDLLSALPHLRAFAMSLTGDIDRADDLVQETIVRALGHLHQFEAGTNLQGWMFTILRNQFHTSFRRQRRECEDPDGTLH
jgi:Sigma-70 region 2